MNPDQIALFSLADRRLAWADRRQQVLTQNIANADTPGFRGRDVVPFAAQLAGRVLAPAPVALPPGALAGTSPSRADTRALPTATTPDGNGIQLDAQLMRVADTETTQALVTGLYGKYLGMFRTALGR